MENNDNINFEEVNEVENFEEFQQVGDFEFVEPPTSTPMPTPTPTPTSEDMEKEKRDRIYKGVENARKIYNDLLLEKKGKKTVKKRQAFRIVLMPIEVVEGQINELKDFKSVGAELILDLDTSVRHILKAIVEGGKERLK
jgi:hypothetical protein